MNVQIISSIIIAIFVLFILLGFICGWVRGFSKSLTRLIMVLIVAVLSYFIVPPITKALLNLNISKFNIVIGSTPAITLQDLVIDLVRKVPFMEDIINASPTFEAFVTLLPQMICNVIFFIILFFLIKWVSMIFYWIIAGIFFSKKKRAGKDKHGFIGAVIGAVQGLVVAIVVLVPVFGILQTVNPVLKAASTEYTPEPQQQMVAYASDENAGDQLDSIIDTVNEYIGGIENNWVYKTLSFVGVKNLTVAMFDGLTTVKATINDEKVEYGLRKEVSTLAKAYPPLKKVIDNGFDMKNQEKLAETLTAIKDAINKLYDSSVLSGMVKEIVPEVANIWLDEQDPGFCGIKKPDLKEYNGLFDALLESISKAQGDTIKNDLITGVELLETFNNNGVLEALSNDGNIIDSIHDPSKFITEVINKAFESETLKGVFPELANVGMNYVYRALGIDPDTIHDIDTSKAVKWEDEFDHNDPTIRTFKGEKSIFKDIVTNVFDVYKSIDQSKNDPISTLDFTKLGMVFDDLRLSQLLGETSWDIMNSFLNSNGLVGDKNTMLTDLINTMKTNWDNPKEYPLVSTFESLGRTIKIARDMQSGNKLDRDSLGELLDSFASGYKDGDPVVQEIVDNLFSADNLKDLGVPEDSAGVVSDTLQSVLKDETLDPEQLKDEIQAAVEVLDVANDVLNATDENPADIKDRAGEIVENLAKSEKLLETLTGETASSVKDLGIKDRITEDSVTELEKSIDALQDENVKNKLKDLFGFNKQA